ncbi:MAG: hypothetical protein Q8Q97_01440 [bacterium]|nr:hypothetical protein [bacterium]
MLKFSEAVLVMLIILSGACFWFLARGALLDLGAGFWSWTALALALSLAFLGLGFFLLPFWLVSLAVFFSASPLFFLFPEEAYSYGLLAAGVSLAAIPVTWRARREAEARLKFSVGAVLRKSLPFFLTLTSVLLAAAFYPASSSLGFPDVIPKSFFEQSLGIAGRTLPFEAVLSFPVPDLYDLLMKTLEARFGAFKAYLPLVYSLGVFAVSRSVFAVIGWVSIVFAWVLVKLGASAGVLVFDRRPLSQEYLRLK